MRCKCHKGCGSSLRNSSHCPTLAVVSKPPVTGIWKCNRITLCRWRLTSSKRCSAFPTTVTTWLLFSGMRTATFTLTSFSSASRMDKGAAKQEWVWTVRLPRVGNIPFQSPIGLQGIVIYDGIPSILPTSSDRDSSKATMTNGTTEKLPQRRSLTNRKKLIKYQHPCAIREFLLRRDHLRSTWSCWIKIQFRGVPS